MAAQVILIEAQPADVATGAAVAVRLAGGGAQRPYDYAGQADWRAGVAGLPTMLASLDYEGGELPSGSVPSAAAIDWAGSDQALLAALAGYLWADAPVTVRIGPESEALPPVLLSGKALEAKVANGRLTIAMADPATAIRKPLLTARFAGTGGLEGPPEWAGEIRRRVWGRVWNLAGDPIDPANNIYCFADPLRPIQAFDAVRDKGAPAAAMAMVDWQGSAAATLAALQAAIAPQGGGVACPSIACVKWWTQPAGELCADLRGEIGTGYVETTAGIAQRLVEAIGGPAFVPGTIGAASVARPAPVGWVASDDSTTVAAMLDELLGNVSLLWLLDDAGRIAIRPWEWGAPVIAATSEEVERRQVLRPLATRRLGFRRNETRMARGDLAGIVLADGVFFPDGEPTRNVPAQLLEDADFLPSYWTLTGGAAAIGTPLSPNGKGISIPVTAGEASWATYDGTRRARFEVQAGKALFVRIRAHSGGTLLVPLTDAGVGVTEGGLLIMDLGPADPADWPLAVDIGWCDAEGNAFLRSNLASIAPTGAIDQVIGPIIPPAEAKRAMLFIGRGAETTGSGQWIVWSPWVAEHQPAADVTANSQITIELAAERTVPADYQGNVSADALAALLWMPQVARGGVSIRAATGTSYALSGQSGGTFLVDNTDGSASKGTVTLSAMPGNEARADLTITVGGVPQPKIQLRALKVLASAPPAAAGKSAAWTGAELLAISASDFTPVFSAPKTVTLGAGETLYGVAPLDYTVAGSDGAARVLTFKWQYAVAGSGAWNDFAAGIAGTVARAARVFGFPEPEFELAEAGTVAVTQSKPGLGAGDYDIRMVASASASGRAVVVSGLATIEARP